MAAVIRGVAVGLVALAITLHIIGFATRNWVSAKIDSSSFEKIVGASGESMGSWGVNVKGMSMEITIGLWKGCVHSTGLGQMMGLGSGPTFSMCHEADQLPDWWKAVQALGILSVITAVVGLVIIIYSFIGDSKGDRARLLPHIVAAVCLLAGIMLLVAVTVYGAKFNETMEEQLNVLSSLGPKASSIAELMRQKTTLGYSFALECISGVLMVLISLLLGVLIFRGKGFHIDGPTNLAV